MSVNWIKQGLVLQPAGQAPWIGSHAALPVVDREDDHHRVYFSTRDRDGSSYIGSCAVSFDNGARVLGFGPEPVLTPGPLGTFDDAGVTPSCVVRRNGQIHLYYTGWSRGVSVPFYLHVGLAVSDDGVTFRRVSRAPLLDRTDVDPYLTASPWVVVEGTTWRMWYVSGTGWSVVDGKPRHHYHIQYAESQDGREWNRNGVVCITYRAADEYAFGRPCVRHDDGLYRMWYSCRGDRYRLGYAESDDGIEWIRKDHEAGLEPSSSGWDSEMVAYPLVFRHNRRLYMLYNGNGYGLTGIGMAIEG